MMIVNKNEDNRRKVPKKRIIKGWTTITETETGK